MGYRLIVQLDLRRHPCQLRLYFVYLVGLTVFAKPTSVSVKSQVPENPPHACMPNFVVDARMDLSHFLWESQIGGHATLQDAQKVSCWFQWGLQACYASTATFDSSVS